MTENKSLYPKVAIIGAGASGLSCAYFLSKKNVHVDVYEKFSHLGGLATSTKLSKGRIDTFYHHLFETDAFILKFLKDLDIQDKVIFRRTITGHIYQNKYYDISGLKNLFTSGLLSKISYIKLLLGGAVIKYLPTLPGIKNISLLEIIDKLFGKEASEKIWKPLIIGKFGENSNFIPYSWLKARIQDRSINLGFAKNGFEEIYEIMSDKIKLNGSNIFLESSIDEIKKDKNKIIINNNIYDKLVVTTSPKTNKKLLVNLNYQKTKISYIGAICGIIEFSRKPTPAYWTGITPSSDKNKPEYNNFLAIISYAELDIYWNKKGTPTWPLYIASYITEEEYKKYSQNTWKEKMIKSIIEISKISMDKKAISRDDILNVNIAFAEYAQPILSPGKNLIPNPEKANNTFFANMHNIYPNDRGQNRAFEIGEKRANEILRELKLIK